MASEPSIVSYIREQMQAGFRKEQIYEALLRAGWYREEVDQAFSEMADQRYSKPQLEDVPKPKKGKGIGKKKIIILVLAALIVALAALYFLNIFDIVSFVSGFLNLSIIPPVDQESVQAYDPQYSYDGTLSFIVKNMLDRQITISSMSSGDCGGVNVVFETTDPTTIVPGDSILYMTGDEKCGPKNPGEKYSVSVSVKYLEEGSMLKTSVLKIEGNVL